MLLIANKWNLVPSFERAYFPIWEADRGQVATLWCAMWLKEESAQISSEGIGALPGLGQGMPVRKSCMKDMRCQGKNEQEDEKGE